jgi:hypothetical protein
MCLPTKVKGVRFVCFGVIPLEDAEVGITAVDDKPAHRGRALKAADFTLVNSTDQDFFSSKQEILVEG